VIKLDNSRLWFFVLALIAILKIVFFYLQTQYGLITLGGTSDAEYYDAIATGQLLESNPWGDFLKNLNNVGLYSRGGVSLVNALLNAFLLPWLFFLILKQPQTNKLSLMGVGVFIYFSVYPTVLYYTVDIHRDVFMLLLFLSSMYAAKCFLTTNGRGFSGALKLRLGWVFLFLIFLYLLFLFRFYLAAAMVAALIACVVFDISGKLILPVTLYLVVMAAANLFGYFDWMKTEYRQTYAAAGSAFGVDFGQGYFAFNFLKSTAMGLYGLYFKSRMSILIFVVESMPAIAATIYIIFNKNYINRFASYLIIFFVCYASVWVIGVDSLGTAARYRIFNYIALLVAAYVVSEQKKVGDEIEQ
jgi:hypothetical protein